MTDLALFLTDLSGGGAERVMINIAEGLADRGYAIDLILAKRQGAYLTGVSPNINLIDLAVTRLSYSLPKLVRYLRRVRPTTMISALDDANIIAILAGMLARIPNRIVITEHCHVTMGANNEKSLKRRLTPFLIGIFYNLADRIIAVSRGVENDLHSLGVARKKTSTIYNPILTPSLRIHLHEAVDHPWLATKELPVIIGMGRLCPQKNFELLIYAFDQVQKQLDSRLIILGEGEERAKLEQLVKTLGLEGLVDLPGFVTCPGSYLSKADVLALSSRWEGFGNVLVEALAAGTPVVSTNCLSGPAEILTDPRYGRLVPVDDVRAMAQAILDLLKDPPQDKEPLRQRAEDFALDHILDQYVMACFQ
jgi:glycosyltransferase involved in cell wall biosynthesis